MAAKVLITVRGGVADYVTDGDVDVEIFDFDNHEAGDEIMLPSSFSALASIMGVPDECVK